jgi:hypothetical protein
LGRRCNRYVLVVRRVARSCKQGAADPRLAEAQAEIARLSEALKEMGVRLMLAEGKGRWD